MNNIRITEFHGPEGHPNEIIIYGDIDEIEAKDYVEDWCDINNCLFNEINFVDGYCMCSCVLMITSEPVS